MLLDVNNVHASWLDFLNREDIKIELEKIEKYLIDQKYFPAKSRIFRFAETNKTKIKVIINLRRKNPHTCVWGGSRFLLDKYIDLIYNICMLRNRKGNRPWVRIAII